MMDSPTEAILHISDSHLYHVEYNVDNNFIQYMPRPSNGQDHLDMFVGRTECVRNDLIIEHNHIGTDDESLAAEALRELATGSFVTTDQITTAQKTDDLPLLPCKNCEMEFHTTSDLNSHAMICIPQTFICPICSDVFERKSDLNNHSNLHTIESTPLSCKVCNSMFADVDELQKHSIMHGLGNKCLVCGLEFTRASSLSNHLKIHSYKQGRIMRKPQIENVEDLVNILEDTPELVTLPNMLYNLNDFQDELNLDVGDNVTINTSLIVDPTNKPHKCTKCPRSFAREKAYLSHVKLHKEVFLNDNACAQCEQCFNNTTALLKHMQFCGIKTEEIPINQDNIADVNVVAFDKNKYTQVCGICNKAFATKQKLFRHQWVHRKKMFGCELCEETFVLRKDLNTHRLDNHQGESNYVCLDCGKNFSSRQGLWEHARVHSKGAKPFVCLICGKAIASRHGMDIHERVHTGIKPYACKHCNKSFIDGGTLRKHEMIHTNYRPFLCPLCPKDFTQKVVLREHVRAIHARHIQKTDMLYLCPLCDSTTEDKDDFCIHLLKHSIKQPKPEIESIIPLPSKDKKIVNEFKCELCGASFKNKHKFAKHIKLHI